MFIETLLVFGMGWLLGKQGGNAKKSAPSTPSQVKWPGGGERPVTRQERADMQAAVDKLKSRQERDAEAMAQAMAEEPTHAPKA